RPGSSAVPCTPIGTAPCCCCTVFLVLPPPQPPSTLFPYTTLFRSSTSQGGSCRRTFPPHSSTGYLRGGDKCAAAFPAGVSSRPRSEEHTSELQSRGHLVCRLLLEKNKITSSTLHVSVARSYSAPVA